MEEEFNIKSFLKICLSCGLGVLGLVLFYNLIVILFDFIDHNWISFTNFLSTFVLNPLVYIKDFIFKYLDILNKTLIISILWTGCITYKISKKYNISPPLFLKRVIIFIAFLSTLLCIFNFVEFNIGYGFLIIILAIINLIVLEESKVRSNNYYDNKTKQLELNFED